DPAGETLLAQRLGRLPAGERGSDDHKRTLIRTHADQPTARAHAGGYRHGSLPVPTRAMHTYARREATAARPAGDRRCKMAGGQVSSGPTDGPTAMRM